MAIAELPSWLAAEERYEPVGARHRVMQKNVLHLASLLERVRLGGGAHEGGSMVARALSCVSAPVRLVGMFVCVLCVCLTQSPLYLMLIAAIALVLVAVRPVRGLRATFVPALGAAGLAVVLALPALLLGASATGAMLKIALKTFINVSLVLGVSWTLTWSRMSAALKMLHLPDEVIFTFDMALKHIEVLGRTAHNLCESVMLRSVGRAPEGFSRTDSIAGIEFAFTSIDFDKAKAYMASNDARSVVMDNVASLVALTGMMTKESTMIYYNGKVLSDRNSEGDWRGTVGFYEDGHVEFWNAGIRDGELVRMTQWVDEAGRDGYLDSGTPWDVVSAASGHPWLVREGHLLTRLEMYWNDTGWETALGEAWNGTRSRSYIGLTYDNKLGVAAVSEGTGTCQAAWLLYKMGWKDVFYVAGCNYLDDGFTPTLKVGGNVVVGKADQAAQYAIAIDVKQ